MLGAFSLALAALSVVKAAPVPSVELATVEASLSLPNTTQVDQTAYYYYQNGKAGACGWVSQDSDVVVGLPREFYSDLASVSPYCGTFVVIEGLNKTVTALVADASTLNDTLTLSIAAWRSLDGDAGLKTVDWRFANETEVAAAKAALQGSSSSVASTSAAATSMKASITSYAAPSSTSQEAAATSAAEKVYSSAAPSSSSTWSPEPSSSSSTQQWKAETTTSTWEALETTSTTSVWESTTTTSQWVAPTTTSQWVAPTTTSQWVAPTTTSQWVAPTTTSQWVAPTTQAAQKKVASASSGSYSGQATFYSQGGAAGSCGNYASDSDYVVAVNESQMNSGWCGKTVTITNTSNGKSITATVADTCPGCGYGSLDLSTGAFGALGSYDSGVLPITWSLS